jgi:hypothetical protein
VFEFAADLRETPACRIVDSFDLFSIVRVLVNGQLIWWTMSLLKAPDYSTGKMPANFN